MEPNSKKLKEVHSDEGSVQALIKENMTIKRESDHDIGEFKIKKSRRR